MKADAVMEFTLNCCPSRTPRGPADDDSWQGTLSGSIFSADSLKN
jgi:hypothetical protein